MSDSPISFKLQPNLKRRIENLALGPGTPANAIVPVFEAVHNALHAIQDRFGDEWFEKGHIDISLIQEEKNNISFIIRDNGIGLNDDQFSSFLTYDSSFKQKIGGKGVGRLSWLKVFERAKFTSVYELEGGKLRRSFDFEIDNGAPIKNHTTSSALGENLGTEVTLFGMKSEYKKNCPTKIETIISKIVSHFIVYLVGETVFKVSFTVGSQTIDLPTFAEKLTQKWDETPFNTERAGQITMKHFLLERSIADSGSKHQIYFSSHNRIVRTEEIGLPLGLSTYIDIAGHPQKPIRILGFMIHLSCRDLEAGRWNIDRFSDFRSTLSG